jgi:hypothetical protein
VRSHTAPLRQLFAPVGFVHVPGPSLHVAPEPELEVLAAFVPQLDTATTPLAWPQTACPFAAISETVQDATSVWPAGQLEPYEASWQ